MLRATSKIASGVQNRRERHLQLLPSLKKVVSPIPFQRGSSKVQQEGKQETNT
jgi:hypothetical protein